MNEQVGTIDITTTGRKTGQPRRIEIWFHNLDGAVYITGLPGQRSWYANLMAQPAFTFHLKGSCRFRVKVDPGVRLNLDPPPRYLGTGSFEISKRRKRTAPAPRRGAERAG